MTTRQNYAWTDGDLRILRDYATPLIRQQVRQQEIANRAKHDLFPGVTPSINGILNRLSDIRREVMAADDFISRNRPQLEEWRREAGERYGRDTPLMIEKPDAKPDRSYQAVVIAAFAFVIALSALIFAIFGGV